MNFNQTIKQITKVAVAFIFTLIVIGSLTSLSNSIFIDKILEDLSSNSMNKINQIKSELVSLKKSLDFNKKRIPHTVVGRKELLEEIKQQEKIIDSLLYVSSPEKAREHLEKITKNLQNTETALSHSVMGRDDLIRKINQQKSDIDAFKSIIALSDSSEVLDINEANSINEIKDTAVEEKKVVVQAPKLSKKCTACHSLNSTGGNRVGPSLWNIVNAPKAKVDGFSYSSSLSSLGGSWTVQDLNLWLKSPKKYAPGNSMSFAGLRKIKDRANMIAFLNSISDEPLPNNGLK